MKKLLPVFVALLVCFSFQAKAETTIAFVDVEKVLSEAKAAKALNKKRVAANEKFVSAVNDAEKDLRDQGNAIAEKGDSLSKEEFLEKKKDYDAKVIEMRNTMLVKKRAFDEASAKALNTLQDHLSDAVKAVAKEKNYDLVLSNRNVVAGDKKLDITEDVIKALNEKDISIPFEVKE
jgi:outer membrane protein